MSRSRILRQYVEGKPHAEEFDTLVPDKIEVLGCRSYTDCSYIETVRFTFSIGNKRGGVAMPPTKKIVELDIETGYISADRVESDLMGLLSGFKIFELEQLVKAFSYRKYYINF